MYDEVLHEQNALGIDDDKQDEWNVYLLTWDEIELQLEATHQTTLAHL